MTTSIEEANRKLEIAKVLINLGKEPTSQEPACQELTPVDWFLNELLENNIIKTADVDIDSYSRAKAMELDKLKEAYSMGRMNKSIKEFNETFKSE